MQPLRKHIVLIGFKHAGKSVIGEGLAKKLQVAFNDLDERIEALYAKKFAKKCTCREIMLQKGEKYFRYLEMTALSEVISSNPCIISLGGGTLGYAENQRLVKSGIVIQITAPRGVVFERILMSGRPAFFNPNEDLWESFNRLWDEREKIYGRVQDFSIENNSSIDHSVNKIIEKLNFEVA